MRRDSNDKKWQDVKQRVFKRDTSCRLCKVLTPTEFLILKRNAGSLIRQLDPAHIIPVSQESSIMYQSWNIVGLNHWSHGMLDSFRNPVTGDFITSEEAKNWWLRILSGDSVQKEFFLKQIDERNIKF